MADKLSTEEIHNKVVEVCKEVHGIIVKHCFSTFPDCGPSRWLLYGRIAQAIFRQHFLFSLVKSDEDINKVIENLDAKK